MSFFVFVSRFLVWLVQEPFRTGRLNQEALWSAVVLLPKGNGDFRGIGLIEALWKVIEKIIDRRLSDSIQFHDVLHGFRAKRGTGTAIIEAKLL